MIHSQNLRDLARNEFQSTHNDYNFFLRSLLNNSHSFDDGNYTPIHCSLNDNEQQLVIRYLDLQQFQPAECKIYGRVRQQNQIYFASVHDEKHKRQSSVCKWLSENEESYGIIHKFVKYNDFNLFIASKFGNKLEIYNIHDFSDPFKQILQINNFGKYFPIFKKFQYAESNTIVCRTERILSTCVMTNVSHTNFILVTPIIGFEHD